MGNEMAAVGVDQEYVVRMAQELIRIPAENPPGDCDCRHALELAIWSDKSKVDRAAVERLRPIVGKVFEAP